MLLDYIILFFSYSYIGWIVEVIYCSRGKMAYNRGFAFGPLCPIYALGAFLMLFISNYTKNIFFLFVLGIIIPTTIEYLTSLVLESLFHVKCWDYSNNKFNLKGRICLLNSLLFGICTIIVVYFLHPHLIKLLKYFSYSQKLIICVSALFFYFLDLFFTIFSLFLSKSKN
jgi:uncharacterized membrane protein